MLRVERLADVALKPLLLFTSFFRFFQFLYSFFLLMLRQFFSLNTRIALFFARQTNHTYHSTEQLKRRKKRGDILRDGLMKVPSEM